MTDQDPLVGKVIEGRYELQARVGEGGMGVVYKARQISIDRVIAMKMLNPQMATDPTWVQRFYNEAKACSRLQHPNTIRMFDFGQTQDGRLFMTMEFLDGISLRAALQQGPLAPQRVVKILIQCCASLAEAHSIGIIHRDIKPDNVFLLNMAGSPDFVKLLDFSVAKLLEGDRMKTQAGVVFGTPQYMSPEQGRGMPLDARSDLYALGVLAWEMLSGTVPYNDDNPMTIIQMHLQAQVPPMPASVPYSVQQIVRRAMEKDAARRYQSAGEMMQHCQQVFAELAGGVAPGGGGVPRTMIAPGNGQMPQVAAPQMPTPIVAGGPAGMPQPQMPPQQQSGLAPQYMQATPQQKTMIAQPSPFAQGTGQPYPQQPQQPGYPPQQQAYPPQQYPGYPPQQQPGYPPPQQPGYPPPQQNPAAGFAPSEQKTIVAGMAPPMMTPGQYPPPGGQYPPPQQPGYPPATQSGPQKTVALQPSEGIVSVARTGGQIAQVGPQTGAVATQGGGASVLFWIVSLFIGIAVGVLAYVIVLQTS